MKKLLIIAILLPCLVMMADDDDKSFVFWRSNGQVKAVRISDVDSITAENANLLDDSLFLFYRDTVIDLQEIHDTAYIDVHDTVTNVVIDTITLRDTTIIELHDTTTIYDTIYTEIHDTTIIDNRDPQHYYNNSQWYVPIENPQVAAYINEVHYSNDDYSVSKIDHYLIDTKYRKDQPWGAPLSWEYKATELEIKGLDDTLCWKFPLAESCREFIVYNLIPNHRYCWSLINGVDTIKQNQFLTLGTVRMINITSGSNMRDLGGMPTSDGRHILFNKIYRGGTLNKISESDCHLLVDTLGIDVEIDVGINSNQTEWSGTSPQLGEGVEYYGYIGKHLNFIPTYNTAVRNYYSKVLLKIIEKLLEGKTIYLHCGGGADRTGAIVFLLQNICGCSEEDIAKDYELTSFSIWGERRRTDGTNYEGNVYNYATTVANLKREFGSNNLNEATVGFITKRLGITDYEIELLRSLLIN